MANSFDKYFFEMAEIISNALGSVPDEQHYLNSTADSHPNTTNQQDHQRLLYAATEAEVCSLIKNLKNTTSVGHDRLKVSNLKSCIDSLVTPITSIVMHDSMVSDITQTQRQRSSILWPTRNCW
jgi:hypothetical protein